ncbi:hypothetical protein EVAR_91341_1 [Eumeta japonica]|uniref:Uncharacterized protein n=1 Tax=Eumeta variegata TaxID=151549 RepID=A0A4C1SNQ7_EUMVA|nr:hypothetical protein EVAR_91341_1 [Eumeta japonica]
MDFLCQYPCQSINQQLSLRMKRRLLLKQQGQLKQQNRCSSNNNNNNVLNKSSSSRNNPSSYSTQTIQCKQINCTTISVLAALVLVALN